MSKAVAGSTTTVALIGNPNTGKSTLFSALVGVRQQVGNYPGVTVEKRCGRMEHAGRRFAVIDLPGLYSLAARSRDEMIAVEVLLGRQHEVGPIDAVLCVVDASNLERHLYLLSQVLELGLPVVVAINMIDIAAKRGIELDLPMLAERLGVPVVPIQANRGVGIDEIKKALGKVAIDRPRGSAPQFPSAMEAEVALLQSLLARGGCHRRQSDKSSERSHSEFENASEASIQADGNFVPVGTACDPDHCMAHALTSGGFSAAPGNSGVGLSGPMATITQTATGTRVPKALVRRLIFDTSGYFQRTLLPLADEQFFVPLMAARGRLEAAGVPVASIETSVRFDWGRQVLANVIKRPADFRITASDRIDHILTHRVWGTMVFAVVMLIVFQAVFVWASPAMDAIGTGFKATGKVIGSHMPEGALQSLVVGGVIAGVSSVVTFLPQILILFFFIAILEDCGYMARAAFLMDKLMSRAGLSGRSFIPMLSSFACAVPGIMAARVIDNERDRLTTILVAPLMTCSARLPVYALLIAAFVPTHFIWNKFGLHLDIYGLQGLTLAGLYLFGIVTALMVALTLKRTLLRGATPPFVMELPSYKWPSPKTVAIRVGERAWMFMKSAGSMILAISIVVWAAQYYPHNPSVVKDLAAAKDQVKAQRQNVPEADAEAAKNLDDRIAELDNRMAAEYQRHSFLGMAGQTIEPVVKPLGWDWRIGCAVIASFPAREVVVATLGIVYGMGKVEPDEAADRDSDVSKDLQSRLQNATWDGTDRKVFTLPVALSLMVFFALCAQCAATLAVIQRETNSWRWPAFTFAYMTTLAYVAAFVTYQVGTFIGL
jgi:ferrous iron transport protein B